ncbi:MAG: hypothetical protein ACUVSQ_02020 [Pseudanabaenaceae cyanobacterium]
MTNCDHRPDLPVENPAPGVTEGAKEECVPPNPEAGTVEVPAHGQATAVVLDPALLAELREVTDEPARAIDTAVRQWLQRRAIKESDTSRPLPVNPFVPPRGEWND